MKYQASESCIVSYPDCFFQACYHHVIHRGRSKPIDKKWNLMPLCLRCHNQIHHKGLEFMAQNYYKIKSWLIDNGWYRCDIQNRWKHEI